jgi:hypothetical protein
MTYLRKSGIRSAPRIKTPAIIVVIRKSRTNPSRAVAGPPAKAALPIAPLATYCSTEIRGFF